MSSSMEFATPMRALSAFAALAQAGVGATPHAMLHAPGSHPPVVTVTARDYAFDAPDSIKSGPTAFRLVSAGHEQHFLGLVKITGSHTVADYRLELAAGHEPSWAIPAGGVGTISPGGSATTTLDLEPGLYAMTCDMTDAHGTPHMLEGMLRPLVVSSRRNGASMPPPNAMFDLTEFAFIGPEKLQPGLRAVGMHNAGSQSHMALVWRLAPGKTARSAIHWMNTPSDSSHPVTLLGGVPDLAPGQEAQLSLRLEAGRYMLICLVEDPKDHKGHYDKGMVKEIIVAATAPSSRRP